MRATQVATGGFTTTAIAHPSPIAYMRGLTASLPHHCR